MEALSSKHPHFCDQICFLLNPVCFLFQFWLLPLCFLLRCLLGHRGRGLGHASGLLAGACLWRANEALPCGAMPGEWIFDAQVAAWREAYGSKADAAALDSSSSRRLLLIECWLHVCTPLPWPHQLLTARNFGSFFCCTCMPAVVLSALIADGMIHPRSWAVLGKVEAKLLGSCGTHVPWTPCLFMIQGCHRGQRTRRY